MSSVVTFYRPVFFWAGTAAIVVGVLSHIPMFIHSAQMNYRLVGMPMDPVMVAGMCAIVFGVAAAFFGVLPRRYEKGSTAIARETHLQFRAIDDAPLSREHWKVIAVLTVAVVIDVMKPATLGLVVPGMSAEYELDRGTVAWFPLAALTGTTVGSILWGVLADKVGRRATILLSALMFIGTSICGAMPTFKWNVLMCFLMGVSAGGLLPITFTLIAEIVPARHRGWMMVLVGGLGTASGYLAATTNAALLEPLYGWRALWFAGVPSGLVLIVLNRYLTESPRFLCLQGRVDEAREILSRFGTTLEAGGQAYHEDRQEHAKGSSPTMLVNRPYTFLTLGLMLCGVGWGMANFGFMLWMPANLREAGLSIEVSNAVLTKSALLAVPGVLAVTWLYYAWSSKKTLVVFSALTAVSLMSFAVIESGVSSTLVLTILLVTLLVATSGVIAVLLPYSAEIYPLEVRATGAGLVAGSSKLGGIVGSGISVWSLITGFTAGGIVAAVPITAAALILGLTAVETRGRRLEEIGRGGGDGRGHRAEGVAVEPR
jgi:putative MFS transporter